MVMEALDWRFFQVAGGCPPAFFFSGVLLREISVFVDESGGQDGQSRYYALTLVFHDQARPIDEMIARHKVGLRDRGLEDMPFHAGPILNGHKEYENLDFATRKSYFTLFFISLQHLPISYRTFVYRRSEVGGKDAFVNRMRRDITDLLFERLDHFQSFDRVKIYYDDGQEMVAKALHQAFEYVLAKNSVLYRKTRASDFMLSQAADMLCTLELTARKFADGEQTRTDEKMFGSARSFKNNYMKAVKRKRLVG